MLGARTETSACSCSEAPDVSGRYPSSATGSIGRSGASMLHCCRLTLGTAGTTDGPQPCASIASAASLWLLSHSKTSSSFTHAETWQKLDFNDFMGRRQDIPHELRTTRLLQARCPGSWHGKNQSLGARLSRMDCDLRIRVLLSANPSAHMNQPAALSTSKCKPSMIPQMQSDSSRLQRF